MRLGLRVENALEFEYWSHRYFFPCQSALPLSVILGFEKTLLFLSSGQHIYIIFLAFLKDELTILLRDRNDDPKSFALRQGRC